MGFRRNLRDVVLAAITFYLSSDVIGRRRNLNELVFSSPVPKDVLGLRRNLCDRVLAAIFLDLCPLM
jgi:hypothetical protein